MESNPKGLLFPIALCAAVPLTSLSLLRLKAPARAERFASKTAEIVLWPTRVNGAGLGAIRDAFHRTRALAPQRSLERPAPAFPGAYGLAGHTLRFAAPCEPTEPHFEVPTARLPSA